MIYIYVGATVAVEGVHLNLCAVICQIPSYIYTCIHICLNIHMYTWQSRAHFSLRAVICQIPMCMRVCVYIYNDLSDVYVIYLHRQCCRGSRVGLFEAGCDLSDTCIYVHVYLYVCSHIHIYVHVYLYACSHIHIDVRGSPW